MNKKILLALPLAGMMLSSCNASAGLPRGYKVVDMNDTAQALAYGAKVAKCLDESYKGALSEGFTLKLHVEVHDFVYEDLNVYEDIETQWGSYDIDDSSIDCLEVDLLKLDLEIKAAHLNETISNMQLSVKIKNLTIQGTAHIDSVSGKIDCKGVDLAIYAHNGNVYADLTDKELLDLANQVLPIVFGEETIETNAYKAIAKIVTNDRYYVKDFPSLFGLNNLFVIPFSKLDPEFLDEVSYTVIEFANFCNNEQRLNGIVTFADYDDGRIGIEGKAKFDDMILDEYDKGEETQIESLTMDASAYALANRKTRLECVHVEGAAKYYSHEDNFTTSKTGEEHVLYNSYTTTIKGTAEVDLVIRYGVDDIRFPKDSKFLELPVSFFF